MRRPAWLRRSGPFKCVSLSSGYIQIQPAWPQYNRVWEVNEGGGPGVFDRLGLAEDIQKFLNSIYSEDELAKGADRISQHEVNMVAGELQMQKEGHRHYYAYLDKDTQMFTHFGQTRAAVEIQLLDKPWRGHIKRIEVKAIG